MKRLYLLTLILFPLVLRADKEVWMAIGKQFTEPAQISSEQIFGQNAPKIKATYPTFFFVESGGKLYQLVRLEVESKGRAGWAQVRAIRSNGEQSSTRFYLKPKRFSVMIKVPDQRQKDKLVLELVYQNRLCQRLSFDWKPERLWKVFIIFVSHLDIGYTDTQDKIFAKRDKILQRAIEYANQTAGWEKHSQFRWTVEGSWTVKHFLENHPEKIDELRRLAEQGRLEICAKLMHLHSSTAGYEELFREIYYSLQELEPLLGTKIETVMHNDVPGFTWGEVSVMSGAGVKYFSFNPNTFYRGGNIVNSADVPKAFYWQGRDGGELLVWRSR